MAKQVHHSLNFISNMDVEIFPVIIWLNSMTIAKHSKQSWII